MKEKFENRLLKGKIKVTCKKEGKKVDALDSSVLTDILERTITDLIDLDQYESILQQEEEDKKKLVAFIGTM